MTQSELTRLAIVVAISAVIAAGLGAAFGGGLFGSGDTETGVTLSAVNGTCTIGKANIVVVRKDKQLVFELENYCTDGPKTVAVGNFQKNAPSTATNCSQAGSDYPFTDSSEAARKKEVDAAKRGSDQSIDPSDAKFKLKAQGESFAGTYYFDICLDGTKVDPMLIVER